MPVIIQLTFPAGRYHATPWGRHVNEGVAEWPPSPWRLMRALVAVWKRTCADIPEPQVRRVLEALTPPPRFKLPRHRVAHTRHYMPTNTKSPKELKGGGTTLIFDTFVSVMRQESLFIGWPDVELSMEDQSILSRLLDNLSSLGRAESWTSAQLTSEPVELDLGQSEQKDSNPIRVLCPDPLSAFDDKYYPTHDAKKLQAGKVKPSTFLFDCPRWHLCLDTETIHAERWPSVPGTRWVNYRRPQEARSIRRQFTTVQSPLPTTVSFLLDGPVLPLVKDTVQIAERFRDAVMSAFAGCARRAEASQYYRPDVDRYASPTFSGKDIAGNILSSDEHASFLPVSDRIDPRRIREVIIYARSGFQSLEMAALRNMQIRERKGSRLLWCSRLLSVADTLSPALQLHGLSSTWISLTPFVAHRHAKSRGSKRDIPENPDDPHGSFLALAIRELCQKRGFPPLIEALPVKAAKDQLQFYEFRRARRKAGNDAYTRTAGYLKLTFAEPISGPLSLGYNCHFGMGLFRPDGTVVSA